MNEFSTFLYTGRCKSLGSLKYSFPMHPSYLGPTSCNWIFHILSSSLMVGSGGIVLPGCPPGSEIHIWRAGIADDHAILVY